MFCLLAERWSLQQRNLSASARHNTTRVTADPTVFNTQLIPLKIMTQKLHVYFCVLLILEFTDMNKKDGYDSVP